MPTVASSLLSSSQAFSYSIPAMEWLMVLGEENVSKRVYVCSSLNARFNCLRLVKILLMA